MIPKVEVDYFLDVDDPHYTRVWQAAKPIGQAIHKATGCTRVGAMVLGMEVPHFHLHLVPMARESDLSFSRAKVLGEAEMESIRAKIVAELEA